MEYLGGGSCLDLVSFEYIEMVAFLSANKQYS
jgi:hypothetical protein